MAVQRTALWIVMGACSLVAVAGMMRRAHRSTRGDRCLRRVGCDLGAVMDGLGAGLSAAFVILLASAVTVWIESGIR